MNRRDFIKILSFSGLALGQGSARLIGRTEPVAVPSYLKDYAALYAKNPRAAAKQWFMDAKYGLFLHYGVYSLLAMGEWVQYRKKIPVKEYEKLMHRFTAERFDADQITDLVLEAEMKYVNITTRHHDSFCLWDTKQTDFKSTNSPCKRDLVAELSEQCQKKGLGICYYYSYGRDWRHPHADNQSRPPYKKPDPSYVYGEKHDLKKYVKFVDDQVTELLTNYGPVSAIWFDAPPEVIQNREVFDPQHTYDLIHKLQPQCLISAKWGITGTEDFNAPESGQFREHREALLAALKKGVPLEICKTLSTGWGYRDSMEKGNNGFDWLLKALKSVREINSNLLLNIGPRGDGSLVDVDVKVLRQMGDYIRKNGFPTGADQKQSS